MKMVEYFGSQWLALLFVSSPIVLCYLFVAFNLYLSRRYLDAMMEALPNSRYLYLWGPYWRNSGWSGRFWLMSNITAMVTWPSTYIRWGDVDPVDLQNFPAHLKRLAVIDSVLLFSGSIWMAVAYVLLELA
ncbi:hypothetical protein [Pseudomonas sp. G(2018)]|uniref:hypothetical protein n=1 Tax=Pseudomonas sp. G(2018) TaxID=2502242 RepID=UPI002114AA63|nr:hypothetical protein [Pseudomonas sp. G(2018)]